MNKSVKYYEAIENINTPDGFRNIINEIEADKEVPYHHKFLLSQQIIQRIEVVGKGFDEHIIFNQALEKLTAAKSSEEVKTLLSETLDKINNPTILAKMVDPFMIRGMELIMEEYFNKHKPIKSSVNDSLFDFLPRGMVGGHPKTFDANFLKHIMKGEFPFHYTPEQDEIDILKFLAEFEGRDIFLSKSNGKQVMEDFLASQHEGREDEKQEEALKKVVGGLIKKEKNKADKQLQYRLTRDEKASIQSHGGSKKHESNYVLNKRILNALLEINEEQRDHQLTFPGLLHVLGFDVDMDDQENSKPNKYWAEMVGLRKYYKY